MIMRGVCLAILTVTAGLVTVTADETSVKILKDIERNLAKFGAYRVEFEMTAGEYAVKGEYSVTGDDFYMKADDVEVYASDGIRREISVSKREIVVDDIKYAAHDIVSNPSKGISILSEDYDSTTVQQNGRTVIVLTPKQTAKTTDTVEVFMDAEGRYPSEIVYVMDTCNVVVKLLAVKSLNGDIPRFDAGKYEGYEVVRL